MKPLIVLTSCFLIANLLMYLFTGSMHYALAGQVAMSLMLFFTAIGHVKFSRGMAAMLPDFFPWKLPIVYLTGIMEVVFAVGLLLPGYRVPTGWCYIIFLVLVLPANIKAAYRHLDYETGQTNGKGPAYLWFRIPLQLLFIGWTYGFVIAHIAD